jgi:hydroxyacylglutathione hydrolase
MMKIEAIPVGMFVMNCYLAWDPSTKEGVVIDPGDEIPRISARIEALGLTISHILLTHGHIDHVAWAEDLHQQLKVPMLLHKDDWSMAQAAPDQAAMFGLPPGPLPILDGEIPAGKEFRAHPFTFDVRHTPGHSPGSATLINHAEHMAFVGDVVFAGSVGRTDLPGCNPKALMTSISEHILTLPDDYRLFPGHGPATTVGQERRTNPFLVQLRA